MSILEVKNLTKDFKGVNAVDNISLSLKEGEILGLLGPNGAGKTTTIQMLLGVLTPTSGEINYFGKDFFSNREEILEQVNFSSTYTNLPNDLTVKECLTYSSYFYAIKERKERIEKIKETFRLEKIFSRQIVSLSAGQMTRVHLAKAFLNYPRVLLLDEPTASLDLEVARYIRDFLLKERENFKVSIIITSHNMAEVEEVCDRTIFINHGKIIADDTPENLARSIKISHVEMMIKDGLKRVADYCEKKNIRYRIKGRYITLDINEDDLPEILNGIKRIGIIYDEISIQKPTLEDYFFDVISKKPTQ